MSAELITTKQFVNTNLKAYYRFESGALTTDTSGESHTLTDIGSPGEDTSGKFGGAVSLGGAEIGTDLSYTDDSGGYSSYATNYWKAMSFTPTKAYLLSVGVMLKKAGSPTGSLTIEIQSSSAGAPSGTVLATTTLDVATLTTTGTEKKLAIPCVLTPSSQYFLCLKGKAAWTTTDNVLWGYVSGTGLPVDYYGPGDFSNNATTVQYTLKTYYGYSLPNSAYSATDHADFKPTGNFTIGLWVKTSNKAANQQLFQSYSDNPNRAGFFLLINGTTGYPYFRSGKNTGDTENTDWDDVIGTSDVCDGVWHFLVGTWDGAKLHLYVDGSEIGTGTTWTSSPGYAATNYVGVGCFNSTGTNSAFLTGSLDDIFLINGTALTTDQIKGIYDGKTNFKLNIGDDWKDADYAYINIGDAWKPVTEAKINIGDTWKTIF